MLWACRGLEPKSDTPTSPARSFCYGWLVGFGLLGSGASWVYISIHNFGNAPPILAGALTFGFTGGIAILTGLAFWLFFKIKSESRLHNALLFLALWVLGDEVRTEFLTGFPWLFLGYGHLNSPLSGWVPIIGVYGITGIAVATGIIALLAFSAEAKKIKIGLGLSISAIWILGFPLNTISWAKDEGKTLSVAMIQSNIPQNIKWKRSQRKKTLELLEKLSAQHWHNDIIIWPETAVPLLYDQALPFLNNMSAQAAEHNTTIISGIPYREVDATSGQSTLHNSIASIGMGDRIYHKQKLVPFGEYVPLQDMLRGLIDFFNLPMSDFRKGPADQALLNAFDYEVAPFICYEVVYPDFVASRAIGADFLLTISNDSWFGKSIGPIQHLEMAQMRAAENARYMIRGTNNGISATINERGEIIAQSKQFIETTLESEIKVMSGRTPFSYLTSYPLFLLCGAYLGWAILLHRRGFRKTNNASSTLV